MNEIEERDPGAVVEGEGGGIDGALRWIGEAVIFVRIDENGGLALPAVYSARVFVGDNVFETGPFNAHYKARAVGIDAPERFDEMALQALTTAVICGPAAFEAAARAAGAVLTGGMFIGSPKVRRTPGPRP